MKCKVLSCCTLLLAAVLSACAPSMTGPDSVGSASAEVRIGLLAFLNPRVPLTDLTDQTPDDVSVILPGCLNAAIAARDVRRLGVQQATAQCQAASTSLLGVIVAVAVAGGVAFALLLLQIMHAISPPPVNPQSVNPQLVPPNFTSSNFTSQVTP